MASDETNKLQIYEHGKPQPIGNGIDMETFMLFDKSDLEAAAVIGDRIYWMSSHSFNSQGEDKPKRKVFFATKIVQANGKPTLEEIGKPVKSLRDPLAKAAGIKPEEMNIEALTVTPEGGLLIGLRAPLFVMEWRSSSRSRTRARLSTTQARRLISARPSRSSWKIAGSEAWRRLAAARPNTPGRPAPYPIARRDLHCSDGPVQGPIPSRSKVSILTGIKPEAAMSVPGQNLLQLLSDDDDICSDEDDDVSKRRFRSIDVHSMS